MQFLAAFSTSLFLADGNLEMHGERAQAAARIDHFALEERDLGEPLPLYQPKIANEPPAYSTRDYHNEIVI
jgi:hypothetical protein